MATVTEDDRAAAHAILCGCARPNCGDHVEPAHQKAAGIIADARERERAQCYAAVCNLRCTKGHGSVDDGCPCIAAAEQAIAARRSP